MKNFKSIALGFVAGALCMTTVSAYAAYADVTAKLFHDVTFVFDGERTASPDDAPVLNYNNYTYVPIRYVAETLGATVDWDIPTKTIRIQSDKKTYVKEVEVEKIVYVEKGETEETAVYSTLPLKQRDEKKAVQVLGLTRDERNSRTRISLHIENFDTDIIKFVNDTAKLTVDGKEYGVHPLAIYFDEDLENYVEYDEEHEGYLVFPLIAEDWEKAVLELQVKDINNDIFTYTFYIKNNKI